MDEKKDFFFNYSINWQQDYPNWDQFIDEINEYVLESSDMKEAMEIIANVKSTLKGKS